jgi:hypothetical protein
VGVSNRTKPGFSKSLLDSRQSGFSGQEPTFGRRWQSSVKAEDVCLGSLSGPMVDLL